MVEHVVEVAVAAAVTLVEVVDNRVCHNLVPLLLGPHFWVIGQMPLNPKQIGRIGLPNPPALTQPHLSKLHKTRDRGFSVRGRLKRTQWVTHLQT